MQKHGRIVRWYETRGFGFIRSPDTTADVFVHARDLAPTLRPVEVGRAVSYQEIHVGGKGPRAMAVEPADAAVPALPAQLASTRLGDSRAARLAAQPNSQQTRPGTRRPASGAALSPAFLALLLALTLLELVLLARLGKRLSLPSWALGCWLLVNGLCFWVYAADKRAAEQQGWRVSEATLHGLSLAGGWLGAGLAQQWLRHKSAKAEFLHVHWAFTALHLGVLAAAAAWA